MVVRVRSKPVIGPICSRNVGGTRIQVAHNYHVARLKPENPLNLGNIHANLVNFGFI